MRHTSKPFKLCALDYRIFITIDELASKNLYSNAKGFYEVFSGDNRAIEYEWVSTFKTLKSTSSKHIAMRLVILTRHKYVGLIYNEKDDELYYKLTSLGVTTLAKYKQKRTCLFKKFETKQKKNIVEIKTGR